ncbi:MAG: GNAT family N-acetyltransferase [Candidatus Asgardarchaeia archaeon]
MNIQIRPATLTDVKGIVEVHCSDIEKWYKYVNHKKFESQYAQLSIEDRWAHGGPWMSIETCAIHLNYLLTSDQYSLVAIMNNKIVGELELYIGEENSILNKTAFIDILFVHKAFRGKGVGRALINKAIEIAKEHNCDTISVWPEKDAIDFYKKCGLTEEAFRLVNLEINLEQTKTDNTVTYHTESFPSDYKILRDMLFITFRNVSSFSAWLKSRWNYAIERRRQILLEGVIQELGSAYLIENLWANRYIARLNLWINDKKNVSDALNYLIKIAKENKFQRIRVVIEDNLYQRYFEGYQYKILSYEFVFNV